MSKKQNLLKEIRSLQTQHKQSFQKKIKDGQHKELVAEHNNQHESEMSTLDDRWHYERCKLLSRWMDDTWQHDTKITHQDYMDQLSTAIDIIRNDSSQILRDAVLFVYYPRFALQHNVNWYDEDAEEAITEQYGTPEQKKVLDLKHKLREAKTRETRSKIEKAIFGKGLDEKN